MTIGQLITPTIRLIRQLGKGGMGSVWAAENLKLGSQVAVKLLNREYADDARYVKRFEQEAQSAARVRSPHVATVYDYGVTADDTPFIVMELLDGETLGRRLKGTGALSFGEAARLVEQVAIGLDAAHKLNLVHRDIKPENLFILDVAGKPFVKIVDFGICKQMDSPPDLTTTLAMIGTPAYMSPEQFTSPKQIDYRSDLWSLGVVVYEALTGIRPFSGETVITLAIAITKGRFKPPSTLQSTIPWVLDEWMAKALAVEPNKRFASAREMAEELAKLLSLNETSKRASGATVEEQSLARPRAMTINAQQRNDARAVTRPHRVEVGSNLEFFEGTWVSDVHGHYYCRVVGGQLRIAYCYAGNSSLSGEWYDCLVVGRSIYARFRWLSASDVRGYIVMHAASDNYAIGGWWGESQVPLSIGADLSKLGGDMPGMKSKTWHRMSAAEPPPGWAQAYFATCSR